MNASNSPPAPRRLNWVDLPPEERFALLRRTESDLSEYLAKAEQIIQAVREEGDSALVRFAQELDKADSFTRDSIRVSDEQITAAPDRLDEEVREAIAFASESIRRFHKDQLPESFWLHEIRQGAFAGERTSPLEQVACYVPRGKGAFPSVFLMTVVPALVAGVKRIVVLTPPGADGACDTATLAAANAIAAFGTGAIEIYLVGGAQAVAAVAHGTETVPKCPRILGPGSPWVAAARRLLADKIDPGVPAGPSEAIVFADGSVGGELAAMDLLVEAEHGSRLISIPSHHRHSRSQRRRQCTSEIMGRNGRKPRRLFVSRAKWQTRRNLACPRCRNSVPVHQRLCSRALRNFVH